MPQSQGSLASSATLGFEAESLWDSSLVKVAMHVRSGRKLPMNRCSSNDAAAGSPTQPRSVEEPVQAASSSTHLEPLCI
jgi:hypothetical protein